jgi:hypothetical protein
MVLDYVEVYNCSQRDTFKSAIRFEGAMLNSSKVSNSAIHHGLGWGINVVDSANILLENNVVFGFKPIGVNIQGSKNVTMDGNVIGGISERIWEVIGKLVDKQAAVAVCSYFYDKGDKCQNIYIRNNIVGGAQYAGFIMPGHQCGVYNKQYYNNTAHSISEGMAGMGLWIFPDPSTNQISTCYEGSYFNAYKTEMMGAFTFMDGKKIVLSNMNMIDTGKGIGLQISMDGTTNNHKDVVPGEFEDHITEIRDSTIWGETKLLDCPANINKGDFCNLKEKWGSMAMSGGNSGKTPHITASSALPPYKIK